MYRLLQLIFINMRGIISVTINFGSLAMIIILMFVPMPKNNNEIIYFLAGLWFGTHKDMSNYFFGSSKDKTDAEKAARVTDPANNPEVSPPTKKPE